MTNVLDLQVGAALSRLRLIERALHDDTGFWEMEYNGIKVPVVRFSREDRVSLVAHFPAMCVLGSPQQALGLYIDGELFRMLPLEKPLDEAGCEVWYDLVLESSVPV